MTKYFAMWLVSLAIFLLGWYHVTKTPYMYSGAYAILIIGCGIPTIWAIFFAVLHFCY